MKPTVIEREPFRSAKTVLQAWYSGSFPDIPIERETRPGEYMDVTEAAEYLRLSERQLRDLCRDEKITHARIDYRTYRFKKTDLDAWFEVYALKRKSVFD
jgi:excisionase family DNA binding protein